MLKKILILLLSLTILSECGGFKKKGQKSAYEPSDEEKAVSIYNEAIKALDKGDAFYAGKKFKEVESLLPQTTWAAKASLMSGYANYARSSYTKAVFDLERHIKNYPADKNLTYAHYLIAICYYEQILDEKKDLQPLLKAKKKFEFIMQTYPDTDYATDARFKFDLIIDQLAAKEMSIARFYMKTKKWIPALNRLKVVVNKYDKTVFIEEALHRLVEVYYILGLEEEAKVAATILGYNYQSGEWYKKSYKVFNKKYKANKIDKEENIGFIRRKIKSLF
jgi:outer membrane protein assembly factor BamD